jgi:hypothetical protein
MTVLHPYAPTVPPARTRAAWQAWGTLDGWCAARGWTVYHVRCTEPDDYEIAVRAVWGTTDLLIAEHDIVPTVAALAGLAACPEPVCAQAYALEWASAAWDGIRGILRDCAQDPGTAARWQAICAAYPRLRASLGLLADAEAAGEPIPGGWRLWAHRVATGDPAQPERWIRPGDAWADYAGFGLTRIRGAVQHLGPPDWAPGTWQDLDTRVSDWLRAHGVRVHVHWPAVAHHHPHGAP